MNRRGEKSQGGKGQKSLPFNTQTTLSYTAPSRVAYTSQHRYIPKGCQDREWQSVYSNSRFLQAIERCFGPVVPRKIGVGTWEKFPTES